MDNLINEIEEKIEQCSILSVEEKKEILEPLFQKL